MKIVILSSNDARGGATIAAYRLHQGLKGLDVDSTMFVADKFSVDDTVVSLAAPAGPAGSLRRLFRRGISGWRNYLSKPYRFEIFTDGRAPFSAEAMAQLPEGDVLNLHWVSGFIDYEVFFNRLPAGRKVVWTLHDMNAFTGGCHYNNGCSRFVDQCGACPQLGSRAENDRSRRIWTRKQGVFSKLSPDLLHIVTPSRWLAQEAARSSLLGKFPVDVIPNGLDVGTFAPADKGSARADFGLPATAKVVLFCADSLDNKRKGFALLLQALRGLRGVPDLFLVSVGGQQVDIDIDLPYLHLGAIRDEKLMAQVYGSADLFVIPSLQDNLPNTILESFACGTPVVGFAAGGIPETVVPGVTGELAAPGDIGDLAAKISALLGDPGLLDRMAVNCRKAAVEKFALEVQAKRYLELYESLVG